MQAEGKFNGLTILADLSARSGKIFDDNKNWDSGEFNLRVLKKFEDLNASLGATSQISPDFAIMSMDSCIKPKDWIKFKCTLYDRVDYSHDTSALGVYVFTGVYPLSWLELHSQFDYQAPDNGNGSSIITNGIRAWTDKNQISVTIDHELTTDVNFSYPQHALLGKLQIRF